MIVTIYGDVVVPRGGVMWMGSLVELCGRLSLSETLVRTAVSRLVAAERLAGERDGRRSYYRLAAAAEAEFAAASEKLYHPPRPAQGWTIHLAPGLPEEAQRGLGRLGGDLYLRPGEGGGPPGLAFRAEPSAGAEALPQLAASLWPLAELAAAYRAMLDRFAPVEPLGARLAPDEALLVRLMLVHDFRAVLLKDPLVPAAALPPDWPGPRAQDLFRALYLALSPAADAAVGASVEGRSGLLPARTEATARRLAELAGAGKHHKNLARALYT